MKIGTGVITLADTNTLKSILIKSMYLTNTSSFIINKRVQKFEGIDTSSRAYDDVTANDVLTQEESSEKVLMKNIKKEYVMKNLMNTIGNIADYVDKCCCVIFYLKMGSHIEFRGLFKLPEIKTEYEYINENNRYINGVIEEITQEALTDTHELDEVIENFKMNALPEVVEYMSENYTDIDIINFRTGNFYKALTKHLGEKFTKSEKEIVSKFLADFKKVKSKIITKPDSYYFEKFKITENDWKRRMSQLQALEPVHRLSASDLLDFA